jgi:cysteine synthase A
MLMKYMPARYILDRAAQEGRLHRGSLIIETTSGTFGLALAILAALRGYRLILVSDPAIDEPLRLHIEDLGAQLEIVHQSDESGNWQGPRMQRLNELLASNPGSFCPGQYHNTYNRGGYSPLAGLLVESLGKIDCLVGSVGSGGSVCGTSEYLRVQFPDLHVIGVDTHGSILFGQPVRPRLLRGLGNSIMPGNLDHTAFNEVHWVSPGEAFAATRALHRKHAIYAGPTSGAAYLVADWWAKQHPDARVAVIFPDEGHRYATTVYNDSWLRENEVWLPDAPTAPVTVNDPVAAGPGWSRICWDRRTYEEVLGTPLPQE